MRCDTMQCDLIRLVLSRLKYSIVSTICAAAIAAQYSMFNFGCSVFCVLCILCSMLNCVSFNRLPLLTNFISVYFLCFITYTRIRSGVYRKYGVENRFVAWLHNQSTTPNRHTHKQIFCESGMAIKGCSTAMHFRYGQIYVPFIHKHLCREPIL